MKTEKGESEVSSKKNKGKNFKGQRKERNGNKRRHIEFGQSNRFADWSKK